MSTPTPNATAPLVEMRNIGKAFGGVHAVDDVSINLYPGEVVALLGHNGAGKSTLMKMLAGAYPIDSGEVFISGEKANIRTPVDAQNCGIESIYQTLALADNLDAVANLFLGRELLTRWNTLDDHRMDADARKVFHRLNKNFKNVRMNKARRLQLETDMSVSQVAAEVGYGFAANFSTRFKNHFGQSPRTLRREQP